MKKFSAHFHKKAKKWYIKHYYGSLYIGKKINKKGELVRRYKQNYKFEYLDLDWNEIPRYNRAERYKSKNKNLINQKLNFCKSQELEKSKKIQKNFFFHGLTNFLETKKRVVKSVNFKPVIDHLLAFSSEKLLFKDINERFCYEFKTYLSEALYLLEGILKTTTIKQYFDHFKHIIKVCF